MYNEPLGTGSDGKPVYLRDIWPSNAEIKRALAESLTAEMFTEQYGNVFSGNDMWNRIARSGGAQYQWDDSSTYIQEPPFFVGLSREVQPITNISGARVLVKVGDSITTDHISPAGSISRTSPAAAYLINNGVEPRDFNSYGARRGNDRIMTRGTFANIRLRNHMAPGTEGGMTTYLPTNEVMTIFDAPR
jgi:aconitate hydratase